MSNLGATFLHEEEYMEAITWFEKALKENPEFFVAQKNLQFARDALAESTASPVVNEPIWDIPFKSSADLGGLAIGAQYGTVALLAKDHCEIWEEGKEKPGYFDFPWHQERNQFQSLTFSMDGKRVFAVGGRVCMIYERASQLIGNGVGPTNLRNLGLH